MRLRLFVAPVIATVIHATVGAGDARAFTSRIASGEKTEAYSSDVGKMPPYNAAIHRLILTEIKRTELPFAMASPFAFIVRFDLDRQGRLVELKLLQGSNSAVANEYAEQIIRRAARSFPPLPADHTGGRASFVLPIQMNMP